MSSSAGCVSEPPALVCREFGIESQTALGGRASQNWLVRTGSTPLVLRRTLPAPWQSAEQHEMSVRWRRQAQACVRGLGWPAAAPEAEPFWYAGAWWALEHHLPGRVVQLEPRRHGQLLAEFHQLEATAIEIGPQPGQLDHLAVLSDESAAAMLSRCGDAEDRDWLLRRLAQARTLSEGLDWSESRHVLVHGDFATHNLLFQGERLSGLLDFELATVDRRVIDLLHVWRCRYDDRLVAYDAVSPLREAEWTMLLVDWWSLLVSLALVELRRGRQPGAWELQGLRRTTPICDDLAPP